MKEYKVNCVKLKELREAAGLTQGQLEVRSGVDQTQISRMEKGERPNATLATLGKLAGALDVFVSELVLEPIPHEELSPTRVFLRQKYGIDERTAIDIEDMIETLLHIRKTKEARERARLRRIAEEREPYKPD